MKTNTQPGAAVSAHTALPWIVTQPDAGTLDICHEGNGCRSRIARLHCELLADEHGGSITANARLIAAAPQMLAALQMVRLPDVHSAARDAIRAAIAAATFSVQPTATPGSAAGAAAKGGAGAE